jgi:HK97 family phage prohead protease
MMERRNVKGAELRASKSDTPGIEGYAAVFNEEYVLWDGASFRVVETVKPGTFTRALKEKQDVRCLYNHDANLLLGRSAAGTLRMKQDDKGLSFTNDMPDTQLGRDVRTSVDRGDLDGCSFAFTVTKQTWREEKKDGVVISTREIEDVDLFDVGPVTYPAYTGTSVGTRSSAALAEMRSQVLSIDGLPAEVRSRIEQGKGQERGKKKDAAECACRCVACARDKKCENCADHMVDCGDEKNCRCMDSRSAAAAGEKRGPVGGGENCTCNCNPCMVGDCQNCDEPGCDDPCCDHTGKGDNDGDDRSSNIAVIDARLLLHGLNTIA